MSYYHYYGDGRSQRSRYYDTTYDRNSPYEQMKRERSRINIIVPGLENIWDLDPNRKSCKYCHEVLILVDDGLNLFCQGCGMRTPTTTTTTTTSPPSNDNSSSSNKDKPTLPKETKSKLKQKDSLENKSFIVSTTEDVQRDRKRKSEIDDGPEDLSALNFLTGLYGNVGDY